MPEKYDPAEIEQGWYSWWETERGLFEPRQAGSPAEGEEKAAQEHSFFSMILPPPNVTGSLHIGHSLTAALEDCLCRWKRMQGSTVVWVPGQDHAGIATQVVVERQLAASTGNKVTRHGLGREAFLTKVHDWREQSGGRILAQLREMGASLDWSRSYFTLDPARSAAVTEAFVRLHEQGLIYRDTRIVNWCPALRTAISDIEVDTEEVSDAELYTVGYRLQEHPDGPSPAVLRVATTRPETLLGDTALAVHPADSRYAHLLGRNAVHPIHGGLIPIVADAVLVDPAFGTGVVKVTPAHSAEDSACARRLGLPAVPVFDDAGLVLPTHGEEFAKLDRPAARRKVLDRLAEKGLFFGSARHAMRLARCSRSGDIVEPVLKPQWFLRCSGDGGLADQAAACLEEGKLKFYPLSLRGQYETIWRQWLENSQDWCISRQLWWGHRIPAWRRPSGDDWFIGRSSDDLAARYGLQPSQIEALVQDEDVLDTWFSSALLPFSAFGWPSPHAAGDLSRFFPLSIMETGSDILFFWVARMTMLSLALTSRVPFASVFLHPVVRDAQGRKMSKSLGNVIDPLDVIHGVSLDAMVDRIQNASGHLDPKERERAAKAARKEFPAGIPRCGTDALRLALVDYTVQGRHINMDLSRVVAARNYAQKMWQAARFCLGHLSDREAAEDLPLALALPCRWVLSKLHRCVAEVSMCMEEYEFASASMRIQRFFLDDFCDQFIEFSKPVLYGSDRTTTTATTTTTTTTATTDSAEAAAVRQTLFVVLSAVLRLSHPFVPFVTEELWHHLHPEDVRRSIMEHPFPMVGRKNSLPPSVVVDADAEAQIDCVIDVVRAARSLRQIRCPQAKSLVIVVGAAPSSSPPSSSLSSAAMAAAASALLHSDMSVRLIQSVARFSSVRVVRLEDMAASAWTAAAASAGELSYVAKVVSSNVRVVIPMTREEVLLDVMRLKKRLGQVELQLEGCQSRLQNEGFMKNAPVAARLQLMEQADKLRLERETLQQELEEIQVSDGGSSSHPSSTPHCE